MRAGVGLLVLLPALAACGAGSGAAPTPRVVQGTPTVLAQRLQVTLVGQPTRSFGSGHWKVCDHGTVTNPSEVVAHGVRLVATYMDHGVVDGQTTLADAPNDGGLVGDLAPGASHDFTICGYSRNEPDQDVVSATPAS